MAKQVFIQNPDAGEPWALCGSVEDHWQDIAGAIGTFIQAEIMNAAENDEKRFSIDFKLVEMTDEEVLALPEI